MSKKPASKTSTKEITIQFDPTNIVTIVSSDGMEFLVDRRCLTSSKTLRRESEENDTINLEYSAAVVEKVIQYLYYKLRYDHDPDSRPPFIVEPEIALNLMVAAHHLET